MKLFHRETDPLFSKIEADDFDLNNISDFNDIQRMLDELVAHLRDVYKSVLMHANIYEGTEIDDIANGAF